MNREHIKALNRAAKRSRHGLSRVKVYNKSQERLRVVASFKK